MSSSQINSITALEVFHKSSEPLLEFPEATRILKRMSEVEMKNNLDPLMIFCNCRCIVFTITAFQATKEHKRYVYAQCRNGC